jgi:hypothetical protein
MWTLRYPLMIGEGPWISYMGFRVLVPCVTFKETITPLLSDRDISPQSRQHLLEFTQCLTNVAHTHRDTLQDFSEIPASLRSLFHPSILPRLAESFSSKSHGPAPESALHDGLTLLGLYHLIYPPNYPQIGRPVPLNSVCDEHRPS